MFLKLRNRRCLVVGAGKISEGKIKGLLEGGAKVQVVAPKASEQILRWHKAKKIRLAQRTFRPNDLKGIFLVVAATNSPEVHRAIYREARARGVLCNIVDVPPLCDFYYPAVVRRGQLQIAISTAGASPSLASRLRQEMEATFGTEYAAWLEHLAHERTKIHAKKIPPAERMEILKTQSSRESFFQFLRGQFPHSPSRKKS
jgi:precorrin-2 dehydrogenase/sirohydrochlorin ferrochelatase